MKKTLLLLALLPAAAFAVDGKNDEYLGASLDYVHHGLTLGSQNLGNQTKQEKNQIGYSVKAGFHSHPNLSWELEYADAGKAKQTFNNAGNTNQLDVSLNSITISAIGHLPLTEKLGLYGRVGVARLSGKASLNGNGAYKARDNVPVMGVGLKAKIDDSWYAYTELTQYGKLQYGKFDNLPTDSHKVRRINAGLSYHY